MNRSELREYVLKPGYIFFSADPTVILSVLGTSVAVTLHDKERRVGGMNHFVYPWLGHEIQPTALYARPAVMQLLRMFHNAGASLEKIEAHVIGGATPPDATGEEAEIGRHNIDAAVRMLEHYDIPISGQEVGGRHGRKLLFNTQSGELVIAKVERIRESDWFPMGTKFPEEETAYDPGELDAQDQIGTDEEESGEESDA